MKSRVSIILAVMVLLLAEFSPLEAEGCCGGPNYTITVNGISGIVTNSIGVTRPNERVEVKICPADLINYEYTIEKTAEKLQEGFSIVGVGSVFDLVSGGAAVAIGGESAAARLSAQVDADSKRLLDEYWAIRKEIGSRREMVLNAIESVKNVASGNLFQGINNCDAWPQKLQDVAGNGVNTPPFYQQHKDQSDALESLEKRRQVLLTQIDDIKLTSLASGQAASNDFLEALKQDVDGLAGEISTLQTTLDSTRDQVDRWSKIMSHNPTPTLSQLFLMPETSARYTIGIKRKPITPLSRKELTETDPAKIQPMQFATTTFENRALHRFNISMGMAAVGRQDSKDFEVASSLDADGNTAYHVREAKQDEAEFEAATFLGIYFNKVDNYDPNRGRAWMVMLGTEISASPTDFFLGLGLDTPRGVIFGFGLTEYEGVTPAKGWKVGQVIPTIQPPSTDAGKPRIAAVPKQRKDTIGAYLFLGFRPSIFKAFLDRRK